MVQVQQFNTVEQLRNGVSVTIRAVRPEDKEIINEAFKNLEPETIYPRYFPHLPTGKSLSVRFAQWRLTMNKLQHSHTVPHSGNAVGRNRRCGERRKRTSKGYIYLSMVGWYCRREKTRRTGDHFSQICSMS